MAHVAISKDLKVSHVDFSVSPAIIFIPVEQETQNEFWLLHTKVPHLEFHNSTLHSNTDTAILYESSKYKSDDGISKPALVELLRHQVGRTKLIEH